MSRRQVGPERDERLKRCPFCGAPAEYERYRTGTHFVRCSGGFPCDAEIGIDADYGTKRDIFAAWNRRTDPQVDGVVQAIEDEGPHPPTHRRIMERHRREWPTLWNALDVLRRVREEE